MNTYLVKRILSIVGVLLGVIGAIGVVTCLIFSLLTFSFTASAQTATGTVTGLVSDAGFNYPQISFVAATGVTATFKLNYSSRNEQYKVGDKVAVLYDPASPEAARLDSFASLWAIPSTLGILGVSSLAAWGLLELISRRLGS